MSFGKRRVPPGQPTNTTAAPPTDVARPEHRYDELRQFMLRLIDETTTIANAVRDETSIDLLLVEGTHDPVSRPISVQGVDEYFTVLNASGRRQHPVFSYAPEKGLRRSDPSAQFHFYLLTSRIMDLNIYCQSARQDGALNVALQSPTLPSLVDRIIVSAAHFAAFFDTLAHAKTTRLHGDERVRLTADRYKAMAVDRMLQPEKYDSYVPYAQWPCRGIEELRDEHPGQRTIKGVYFPAEQVAGVLDHDARSRPLVHRGHA